MTQPALRDRIAAALYERERPPRDPHWPDAYAADREVFEAMADAVLPVLSEPADRAAVLPAPAVWVDGDSLMEAIAAAVWEHCARDDVDMPQLVLDDPRNIAAAAASVVAAERAALKRVREYLEPRVKDVAVDPAEVFNLIGAIEPPLSPYYSHEACGFHWHGRDGMDIPMRDGQPVCPRCELRRLTAATDTTWPRRAWDLGLLHKGGDPHHCPACVAQPEPPKDFICPGADANAEVLANPQPATTPGGGPPCGNNPNFHLTPGDRQAVDDFKAYLARSAAETRQDEAQPSEVTVYLSTRCDACEHTLNWHRNDVGCTVARCVCGRFQPPAEDEAQP